MDSKTSAILHRIELAEADVELVIIHLSRLLPEGQIAGATSDDLIGALRYAKYLVEDLEAVIRYQTIEERLQSE